jgi:tricorn protease
VRPADGTGAERQVTKLGPGFRYGAQWSPDNKKIAFADQAMRIRIVDVETGAVTNVDQSPQWLSHGPLQGWRFSWSADSRWLAWQRPRAERGNTAIFLFDTRTNTRRQSRIEWLRSFPPSRRGSQGYGQPATGRVTFDGPGAP